MTARTTVAGIDTDNNQLKVAAEAAMEEILMAMATAMTMTTAMMTAAIFTPTTTWKGSRQMTLLVE
jgi:hypothetical protein